MATPRRPEPPNQMGFFGFVFLLLILAGVVWLAMLIFRREPYQPESVPETQIADVTTESLPLVNHTATLTSTIRPSPTETLTPSPTPTVTPTSTPEVYPFVLIGAPEMMNYALIRPGLSCDYLIIAGQVWDLQDVPVTDSITVHLYGELGGFTIDRYALPGTAFVYGESGYEFVLEGLVVDSFDSLTIRLEDTNGLPLSAGYLIQTYEDCQRNLILVNFKQVR
jgi:hypothetical protein